MAEGVLIRSWVKQLRINAGGTAFVLRVLVWGAVLAGRVTFRYLGGNGLVEYAQRSAVIHRLPGLGAGLQRGAAPPESDSNMEAIARGVWLQVVILRVRLPSDSESAFFEHVGEAGSMTERGQLAALFEAAAVAVTPPPFVEDWQTFCRELAREASSGVSLLPCFDRANAAQVAQILGALPRLLSWRGESFRRFASAVTFGDSKSLEALQPRIEACLARLTAGRFETLNQLGVRENPRSVILHGPLTLKMPGGALHLGHLGAPFRIGAADLETASITTAATRCVTVENAAMLHELAKNQWRRSCEQRERRRLCAHGDC